MGFFVRKEVLGARPALHGGLNYGRLAEEGVRPGDVTDFSVSTNPFPPHPDVAAAVAGAALTRYPDSYCGELSAALADLHGVSRGSVLAVNGLAQAIFLCAFAFADRGRTVLTAPPTFGEYKNASELAGAVVAEIHAREVEGFALPAREIERMIETASPSVVWLCSPNNPTGFLPEREELNRLLALCRKSGTTLILDEAYINFGPPGSSALPLMGPNLVILRSMTKDYGLTGLRLGYILAPKETIGVLSSLQPPWSVNACAQAAGMAVLRRRGYYEAQWEDLRAAGRELASGLAAIGFSPLPSSGNFLLFRAGDVKALSEFLWERRILVRNCASFGLEGYVRVGVRTRGENACLLEALARYREGR